MRLYSLDYASDRNLLRWGGGTRALAGLAMGLVLLPFAIPAYFTGEITFVFIMCIASLGLMILTGYTGQVSLGHGAFLAIGGYAHALMLANGVPFALSLSGATGAAAVAGLAIGIPAIRVSGLHLAMVTMAAAIVIEHVLGQWSAVTGGHSGLSVAVPAVFGVSIGGPKAFYFLCLGLLAMVVLGLLNLLRSPMGRAWVGVRDSEAAARALGIHVAACKLSAFVVSAAVCGLAGGLLAHQTQFITPDAFGLPLSLQLMMMVFVGGMGSLRGAILGAILIAALPTGISMLKVHLPGSLQEGLGLVPLVSGIVLAFFVILEPKGLDGRWRSIGQYLREFPLAGRNSSSRNKSYMRSERYR